MKFSANAHVTTNDSIHFPGRIAMNALKIAVGSVTLLMASLAHARAVPLDDSGLMLVAASALVAVIGIARRKQKR